MNKMALVAIALVCILLAGCGTINRYCNSLPATHTRCERVGSGFQCDEVESADCFDRMLNAGAQWYKDVGVPLIISTYSGGGEAGGIIGIVGKKVVRKSVELALNDKGGSEHAR